MAPETDKDTEAIPIVGKATSGHTPSYSNIHNHHHSTKTTTTTDLCGQDPDEDKTQDPVNENKIENRPKFKFSAAPRKKKIGLVLCVVANFLSGVAVSLLGPFYPREAEKKGMSLTMIGFVFSVYQLVIFVASPIIGNFMTRIGVKFVFISGILVGAVCAILFGLLDKGPGGTVFIVLSILVRAIEGLGFAGFRTASMTTVSNDFPEHVATVLALLKTGSGLGYMLGPIIASFLYELGGYGLPFYTIGVLILINAGVLLKFLPDATDDYDQKTAKKGSLLRLFKSPMVVFSMCVVFLALFGSNFIVPSLSGHLAPYSMPPAAEGAMYSIVPFLYIIVSPIAGYIADAKDAQSGLIILGNFFGFLAWMIIGPSPLLPFIPAAVWSIAIALFLIGVGFGCLIVSTMKCMVKGAVELGYERNANTNALVSGLYNSAYALGGFTGPVAGGALVVSFGYPDGYTIVGLGNLAMFLLSLVFFSCRYYRSVRESKQWGDA